MSEKDIVRINVGKHPVSLVGFNEVISRLATTHGDRLDDEIGAAMLEALEKKNYIPASAKEEYLKAFVREFRRSLGQPYTEDLPEGLDIKVLGAGCNQCDRLEGLIMESLTELNIKANLEHVRDMREIAGYGVMGVPALMINGRVVSTGTLPPKQRIKSWILDAVSGTAGK